MSDEDESFPIHHLDLAAEARQYAWSGTASTKPCPDAAHHGNPFRYCATCNWTEPGDTQPTSVQALDTQDQVATAETQRDLAQGDADRHLRNAKYLGGLLEQIARTLGANPLDLEELPALVDGCRTAHDQASIHASDLAHALDRAEAGATLWKTRLVHETQRLRGHLDKARLTTARAEARAGAYCLAHDHLDAVTRKLVDTIRQHINREPLGVHHLLTQNDRDRLLDATDTVHDALSRDTESYLAEPYDDITAETRVDLTPAGMAVTSQPNTCRCTWLGIGTPEHPTTSLCLTPEQDQTNRDRFATSNSHCWCAWQSGAEHHRNDLFCVDAGVASVPPVARESGRLAAQGEAVNATDQVLCDVADERTVQDARWGVQNHPDGTSRLLAGMADDVRRDAQHAASQRRLTWSHILTEEFWEARCPRRTRRGCGWSWSRSPRWRWRGLRPSTGALSRWPAVAEPRLYRIESTVHFELDEDQDAAYRDEPTLVTPAQASTPAPAAATTYVGEQMHWPSSARGRIR